jgi:hypothetical protein
MDFTGIRFSKIKQEIETFLTDEYNKANLLFSAASPYGQILAVLENLHQLSFLYLKNTINNFDLSLPNSMNERVIRNAAIFAGHIPTRSISATGTLQLTLKSGVDIETEIKGARITIENRLALKNKSNGLEYAVNLGKDRVTHKITPNYSFFLSIIQGTWKVSRNTGSGKPLQTFEIVEIGLSDIENFNVEVLVNGEYWTNKRHMYDMLPDEKSVVVRSGFNGGINVIFGNGNFGMMPPLGSEIVINYLVTDGPDGNIFSRSFNDWSFIGQLTDRNGNSVDGEKTFDISIYTDINFGAGGESFLFTKQMLPMVSNNAVLALPQHFIYEIKKLGVFSHVNAYEKSGTIFITATPNVNLFKSQGANYFTVDIDAFSLDAYEKSKIDRYLRSGGQIMLTKKYKITSPDLSYYAINVFVIPYSDATDESVNAEILSRISDYFLSLTKTDRIPKADIIRKLSFIKDIHSVDIQFVCKKNEDYHKQGIVNWNNQTNQMNPNVTTPNQPTDYSPSATIGIDPTLGDIIFEPNEIPLIRGGWNDRNDTFYSDDIESSSMKAVNIFRKGSVDAKNRPR